MCSRILTVAVFKGIYNGSRLVNTRRLEMPNALSRYRAIIDRALRDVLDDNSNFSFSRMLYAFLKQVIMNKCRFSGVNARGSDMSFSKMTEVDMKGSTLKYAALNSCTFNDVNFSNSNMIGVDLKDAQCEGVQGEGANMEGSDLTYANFKGSNLKNAFLLETNLHGNFSLWALW